MRGHGRNFLGQVANGVFDNIASPPLATLRSVVTRLYALQPDHVFFHRIDWQRRRWVLVAPQDLDRHVEQLIRERPEQDLGPIEDVSAAEYRDPMGELAIRFTRSDRRFVCGCDHALGDGRTLTWAFAALIQAGRYEDPTILLDTRGVSFPLVRAFAHHWGRHPGRIVQTLRQPRPSPGFLPADPSGTPPPSDLSVARVVMRREQVAELRRWRKERSPGSLISAVLASATARALGDAGIELITPGLTMLVDARRYLPTGTPVAGVFVSPVFIQPDDLYDPASVTSAMNESIDSGRALAALAVSTGRTLVRRSAGPPEGTPGRPLARLSLSHLQRPPLYAQLPWIGGPEAAGYAVLVAPTGTIGLSVICVELGGQMHVNAISRPSAMPREAVAAAIAALCDDPVSLASRGRV